VSPDFGQWNRSAGAAISGAGKDCFGLKAKAKKPSKARAPKKKTKRVVARERVMSKDIGFRAGDYVVYPTHGVGKVTGIETQEISGVSLQVIIINFDKDRMTLRVPVAKAKNSGLRRLSTRKVMETALATLKGRSRVKRAMWSRRAQEYEAKINSGDPVSIAEVVRDLHRNADQPDQSYSERQIYQAALDRLVRELAAVESIDEQAATQKLEQVLKAA
jgi:CarD family transcriptional regulator